MHTHGAVGKRWWLCPCPAPALLLPLLAGRALWPWQSSSGHDPESCSLSQGSPKQVCCCPHCFYPSAGHWGLSQLPRVGSAVQTQFPDANKVVLTVNSSVVVFFISMFYSLPDSTEIFSGSISSRINISAHQVCSIRVDCQITAFLPASAALCYGIKLH